MAIQPTKIGGKPLDISYFNMLTQCWPNADATLAQYWPKYWPSLPIQHHNLSLPCMHNVRLTTCRLKLPNILYLLTKFVHGRLSDFLSPLHLPRSLDIPISISFLALSKVRARSLEFFWKDRNETVLFQMYIDLISLRFHVLSSKQAGYRMIKVLVFASKAKRTGDISVFFGQEETSNVKWRSIFLVPRSTCVYL